MSVNKRVIAMLVSLIVLLEPPVFAYYGAINAAWLVARSIVGLAAFLQTLRIGPNRCSFLVLLISFTIIISAIFHSVPMVDAARTVIPYASLVFFFDWQTRRGDHLVLRMAEALLFVYFLINLAAIIAFPNGLVQAIAIDNKTVVSIWFLGQKNVQVRYAMPYLYLMLCISQEQYGTIRKAPVLAKAIVPVACVIITGSATGIIGIVTFGAVFIVAMRSERIARFVLHPAVVLGALLLVSIGFVVTRSTLLYDILGHVIADKDTQSASARVYVWNAAIRLVQKNWLLGTGTPGFASTKNWLVSHPHNYVLYQWLMGGLPCVAFSGVLFYDVMSSGYEHFDQFESRMVYVYVIAVLVMGIDESLTEFPLLYVPLAVHMNAMAGLGKARRKRRKKTRIRLRWGSTTRTADR